MPDPHQILLHPGFHRTGTSSMQHFLWLNRDAIAPYLTVRLTRHFKSVARLCTRYAVTQNPLDLTDMITELDTAFAQDPVPSNRNLIISSEAFCGEIPGHNTVADYSAAPTLITRCGRLAFQRVSPCFAPQPRDHDPRGICRDISRCR